MIIGGLSAGRISLTRREGCDTLRDMSIQLIQADARHLPLADESVQCIVTSPPYWGLRKYAGDQGEQPYSLEPTIEAYIATTVEVLRECRRVLRKDGVLFWNI